MRVFLSHFIIRRIAYYAFQVFLLSILLLVTLDQAISLYVHNQVYTDDKTLPHRPYALVLGTSKYSSKNTPNLFYSYRLAAAKTLFDTKKVDYLLLSGDNATKYYNEPMTMYRDLQKMNIPKQFMFMDFAGFRTLDSVVRANKVFYANSLTIISQRWHCERALFIAKYYNIDAICFTAKDPDIYFYTRIREVFARLQAIWDLISEKGPHFLGTPEPLPPPLIPKIE